MRSFVASSVLTAALLAASPAGAESIDFRVTAGLPRAGIADGRALAWRNVRLVAQADWVDVEIKTPGCILSNPGSGHPGTDPGSAGCLDGSVDFASAGAGSQYAITFKVPQWQANSPLLDIAFRRMQAVARADDASLRTQGVSAEIVLTQPVGQFDLLAGLVLPVASGRFTAGGRGAFAGVAWQLARGTSLEFIAEAGEQPGTPVLDRALTVRFTHALRAKGLRVAAWTTHTQNDGFDPWRAGVGVEYTY